MHFGRYFTHKSIQGITVAVCVFEQEKQILVDFFLHLFVLLKTFIVIEHSLDDETWEPVNS